MLQPDYFSLHQLTNTAFSFLKQRSLFIYQSIWLQSSSIARRISPAPSSDDQIQKIIRRRRAIAMQPTTDWAIDLMSPIATHDFCDDRYNSQFPDFRLIHNLRCLLRCMNERSIFSAGVYCRMMATVCTSYFQPSTNDIKQLTILYVCQ